MEDSHGSGGGGGGVGTGGSDGGNTRPLPVPLLDPNYNDNSSSNNNNNITTSSSIMRFLGWGAAAVVAFSVYYCYINYYRRRQQKHPQSSTEKPRSKSCSGSHDNHETNNKAPPPQKHEWNAPKEEEEEGRNESVVVVVDNETTPLLLSSSSFSIPPKAKSVIARFEQQEEANQRYQKQQQQQQQQPTRATFSHKKQLKQHACTKERDTFKAAIAEDLMASSSSLASLSLIAESTPTITAATAAHTNKEEAPQQPERCSVCRKKLPVDNNTHIPNNKDETTYTNVTRIIHYQQWRLHKSCFVCRECRVPFGNDNDDANNPTASTTTIQTSHSNGKVKLTCGNCCSTSHLVDSYSSIAGQRMTLDDTEQGNVDGVIAEIGDDLEQAVYFMTPRCATCGDDLQAWYHRQQQQQKQRQKQQQEQNGCGSGNGDMVDVEMPKIKVIGRTVYHPYCFETGRPQELVDDAVPSDDDDHAVQNDDDDTTGEQAEKRSSSAIVKLPPSFCAKYLPPQIILKLLSSSVSSDTTLTTLYFYWKNREIEATRVRQENAAIVRVPFVLDPNAPANPNYCRNESTNDPTAAANSSSLSQLETQEPENNRNDTNRKSTTNDTIFNKKVKRKKPPTRIPLSLDTATDVSQLQLELVTGVQVGPRHPIMPKPACIRDAGPPPSSHDLEESGARRRVLDAQLTYLHFGLEYCLALQIPLVGDDKPEAPDVNGERQSAAANTFLNLTEATLSVAIQDWQQ